MHHGPTDSGIFAVREMVPQEDVDKCSFRVLYGHAAEGSGQPKELPTVKR
jgi:hypothetical protein